MNNKGFSLIELLAVIALIAIILLIFIPNITKMIDKFRDEDKVEILKNNAISAAKEYVVDGNLNSNSVSCGMNEGIILVQSDNSSDKTLVSEKYLLADDYYVGKSISVRYNCDSKKFTDYKFN